MSREMRSKTKALSADPDCHLIYVLNWYWVSTENTKAPSQLNCFFTLSYWKLSRRLIFDKMKQNALKRACLYGYITSSPLWSYFCRGLRKCNGFQRELCLVISAEPYLLGKKHVCTGRTEFFDGTCPLYSKEYVEKPVLDLSSAASSSSDEKRGKWRLVEAVDFTCL